jgi:hypothetical protein
LGLDSISSLGFIVDFDGEYFGFGQLSNRKREASQHGEHFVANLLKPPA